MSDFGQALAKTLRCEGGFADLRSTTGEVVSKGITHWTLRGLGLMPSVSTATPRSVPASDAEVEIVRTLSPEITASIYQHQYWEPIRAAELRYQLLADKFFDLAVNCGTGTAAKLLQRAINEIGTPDIAVVEDGSVGRKTLDAANGIYGGTLLGRCAQDGEPGTGLRGAAEHYYRSIKDPGKNLEAWLDRLRGD